MQVNTDSVSCKGFWGYIYEYNFQIIHHYRKIKMGEGMAQWDRCMLGTIGQDSTILSVFLSVRQGDNYI